ncbi:hypothetical protein GCM10027446_12820 [Angustibacter peucedani]
MGDTKALERAAAIEGFAADLTALRDAAGKPSFRVMSGRSRIISHTTLHEAAQGNRLPSWGTTVEFVKACGADPADYRERWERASRAVCPAVVRTTPVVLVPSAAAAVPTRGRIDVPVADPQDALPAAGPSGPSSTVPEPGGTTPTGRRPRRRRVVLVALVAVLLVAGSGVAWAATHGHAPTAATPPHRYLAADCPVHQQNPPVQGPTHEGDKAAFVADITLPDCAHVAHGTTVDKVWRLKNAGTVAWKGYTLHRVDLPQGRDTCQTIADVPVPDTAPGKLVDVTAEITVPGASGFCFVRFKMLDASGQVAFPGSRPVNFQVVVD